MAFWKRIKRAAGVSDARYWRQPGYFRLRLAGDAIQRLAYSLGIGLLCGGIAGGIMICVAPPDQLLFAIGLTLLAVFVTGMLVFLVRDTEEVIVSLEDTSIRRRSKPLLINPFGTRNRDERWPFASVSGCGIVPNEMMPGNYSVLVLEVAGETLAIGIPFRVDWRSVVEQLAGHGIETRTLDEIPAAAIPESSISRRDYVRSAILGTIGTVLIGAGGIARLAIYAPKATVDQAAVQRDVDKSPAVDVTVELTGAGKGGLQQGCISADGRWVWGMTYGKVPKHLVWNVAQPKPVGEIDLPAARRIDAAFSRDGSRLVLLHDGELTVWRLPDLEQERQFRPPARPNHFAISPDSSRLAVAGTSGVRIYDLSTGESVAEPSAPIGAVTDVAFSADGQTIIVAQQSRIISVPAADGEATEIVAFQKPNAAYLFGSLSGDGRWAAMRGSSGIDVFDLSAGEKRPTISGGMAGSSPAITSDGRRVVGTYRGGAAVWDASTGQPVARIPGSSRMRVELSDGGQWIVGYARGTSPVSIWQMPE